MYISLDPRLTKPIERVKRENEEKIKKKRKKKRKGRDKGEFRERDTTFSLHFPVIGRRFQVEQKGKFFLVERALHRDRIWRVSTKFER